MKKNNHQSEGPVPPETGVLREFARLHTILVETHSTIPNLLASERTISHQLGVAEGRGESGDSLKQLEEVAQQRQAAIWRRMASIAAITELEASLQGERARVSEELRAYAGEALAAFARRYDAAIESLQSLWSEAQVLSRTLRCAVPTPRPATFEHSAPQIPAVDAEAARLGAMLDRLDAALGLCNAIRQNGELEARHHRLSMERGLGREYSGIYKVLVPFHSQVDGCEFQAGELIDLSLIGGSGMAHRLMAGKKYIMPIGSAVA